VRLGIALGPPARTAAAIELAVRAGAPAESLQGLSRPALVEEDDLTVILAHPGDLLTLCARDALDVAVLGKEVVLEGGFEVVELLDLGQGVARLVLAGVAGGRDESLRRPLVATAHPRLTRRHFRARGRQPRLVEFASDPWIAGRLLAVDLVVGLLDEGEEPPAPLVEREQVLAGGLRLVAGLAAHALRGAELAVLTRRFREVVRS
jgi:ATP phosphoribosyltransferase